MIETPSSHPYFQPCDATPNTKEAIAAKQRILIVSSSKFYKTISHRVVGYFVTGSFLPNFLIRYFLSSEVAEIPFYLSN
jgi:hypothetical protein